MSYDLDRRPESWTRRLPGALLTVAGNPVLSTPDGKRLAELMIDYGVGVQLVQPYKVVKLDEDFFE